MSSYYHYTRMPFCMEQFYFHDRSSLSFHLQLICPKNFNLLIMVLTAVLVVSFSWSSIFWTWTQIKKLQLIFYFFLLLYEVLKHVFYWCCRKNGERITWTSKGKLLDVLEKVKRSVCRILYIFKFSSTDAILFNIR